MAARRVPARPAPGRRSRLLWGVLLGMSVLVFVGGYLVTRPPSSYEAVAGPSEQGVNTEGVFRPGGYIDIEFHPGIASIRGHYRGTAQIRLYQGGDSSDAWLDVQMPIGKDWPNSFSGDPDEEDFTVEHRVYLPDDEVHPGRAELVLNYQLFYPVDAGPGSALTSYFKDASGREHVSVPVELSAERLSPAEVAWLDRVSAWSPVLDTAAAVALVVGISSLFMLAIRRPKR
ncbi:MULTISPECIES: hypothetical protein [Tessaracoccus]|uniref:hypothetical protein n=1 Tax=Tessaracoccus TaxID=72763 RepID=UPI001146707E|nr:MULTISPECIES: hypothetical protein [Tessaracoccus]